MGRDVVFDREEAKKAGMECAADGGDNLIRVPGMETWSVDKGAGNKVVVTANEWGRVYKPLTQWLMDSGIKWMEG